MPISVIDRDEVLDANTQLSIREIQPWCLEAEELIDDTGQCLIVSHHPEIIDHLAGTRGIWMKRLGSGESQIMDEPMIGDNKELLTYSQVISRGLLDEAE